VGIRPGATAGTPGMAKLAPTEASGSKDDLVTSTIPLGRMGTTQELGHLAVFLVSDMGQYITGDVICMDGGNRLYKPPMLPREAVAGFAKGIENKSRATGLPPSKL